MPKENVGKHVRRTCYRDSNFVSSHVQLQLDHNSFQYARSLQSLFHLTMMRFFSAWSFWTLLLWSIALVMTLGIGILFVRT